MRKAPNAGPYQLNLFGCYAVAGLYIEGFANLDCFASFSIDWAWSMQLPQVAATPRCSLSS